jgi:inner membrane protein
MNWWAWIVCGIVLFGAEVAAINAQFYLVFAGSAAIVVGLAAVSMPNLSPATQWAAFAILAIVSMLTFRNRIYNSLKGRFPVLHIGPTGSVLTLSDDLAPGESCQVEHGGTHWTARNDGSALIPARTSVRVTDVRGLTLIVRPDSERDKTI